MKCNDGNPLQEKGLEGVDEAKSNDWFPLVVTVIVKQKKPSLNKNMLAAVEQELQQ